MWLRAPAMRWSVLPGPMRSLRLEARATPAARLARPALTLAAAGEAHITSKDVKPYLAWRIGKLADDVPGVVLARKVPFDATRYAGWGGA